MVTARVKVSVKLTGGTVELTPEGVVLLNAEVDTRKGWYAHFDGGAPRKVEGKYTPQQSASLRALEKCKAAFVLHIGAANFKEAARLVGYAPQYAPRVRV